MSVLKTNSPQVRREEISCQLNEDMSFYVTSVNLVRPACKVKLLRPCLIAIGKDVKIRLGRGTDEMPVTHSNRDN